ncbi:MAG: hypothetical protein D6753_15600 [Planctomycetota bacterium]|nr:MAG: hypothetical protein D6753_15600 [Planctomycetota bacterium]
MREPVGVDAEGTAAQQRPLSEQQRRAWIAELIEQLADPSYHRRQNAQWQLQQLGMDAFEQLREATMHPNVHIASTARYIINSQNIVWWLDSDSVEVRSYLRDYNTLDENQRTNKILLLGEKGSPDALLALCRLARYERFESLSKRAALTLLSALTRAPTGEWEPKSSAADANPRPDVDPQVMESIALAIGDSQRPAIQWIRAFLADVQSPDSVDIRKWEQLAAEELQRHRDEQQRAATRDVLELYRWIGTWVSGRVSREAALELVRPCLEIVNTDSYSIREFCVWALDRCQMPELVRDLAELHPSIFDTFGDLKYLLAESYLHIGDVATADKVAAEASDALGNPPQEARRLAQRLGLPKDVAAARFETARQLTARGMFDWAEREYHRALEENVTSYEEVIRISFAEFYWFGGDNAKAAEVLRPLVETAEEDLTQRRMVNPRIRSNYYFYAGLAAIDGGDANAARIFLRKAYEADPSNPDIVIAMREVADDDAFNRFYQQCFEEMRDRFRQSVLESEARLAQANDRSDRRSAEQILAMDCNQLAWLLGKCEEDAEEAIQLSQRSLELSPDEPAYLDTLARCYFSAGQVAKAVETQRKAVRLAPHERQMLAQLHEFERALQAREQGAPADSLQD